MSSFRLNMWKMPQNWCQNPLTQQTECWLPPSQWPAVGGVTFGRTMSACVHIIIPENHFWLEHEGSNSFILLARHLWAGIQPGRCKGTVIKNKRETVGTFLAWFFFPSSFFTKVHLEAGAWVGSQSSYFFWCFLASYFDYPWHYLFSFFFFLANFLCQGILLYTFCSFL